MTIRRVNFMSRRAAEALTDRDDLVIISITERDASPAILGIPEARILRLSFHDVDPGSEKAAAGFDVFDRGHANAIIEWVRVWQSQPRQVDLICHCKAGISRSAAVATYVANETGCEFPRQSGTQLANRHVLSLLCLEAGRSGPSSFGRPSFDLLEAPPEHEGTSERLVFLDTEFTSLENPELMSIGMVAADSGAELYIEVAGAKAMTVSDFVRHEVFPHFGKHDPLVLEYDVIAPCIEGWFDELRAGDRRTGIGLLLDHPIDWALFAELRIPAPGAPSWTRSINVGARMLQHVLASGRQLAAYAEALEHVHSRVRERHHALVDARAMRYAFAEARSE
jgi:predicted protein tyrosine phosphatase